MKFKYKSFSIFCFAILFSSCSFSTKIEYTDYLINKYVLNNVVDYTESLMIEHSYINTFGLQVYNDYFNLNNSFINFNYGSEEADINFDFNLAKTDLNTIHIEGVSYNFLATENISNVLTDYSGGDFEFYEITVFPNYWLRVRTHFQINGDTKELIFEYKSNGRNQ